MPKSRDPGRSISSPLRNEVDPAPPDREVVERAIEAIVAQLKPKPLKAKPVRKARQIVRTIGTLWIG